MLWRCFCSANERHLHKLSENAARKMILLIEAMILQAVNNITFFSCRKLNNRRQSSDIYFAADARGHLFIEDGIFTRGFLFEFTHVFRVPRIAFFKFFIFLDSLLSGQSRIM